VDELIADGKLMMVLGDKKTGREMMRGWTRRGCGQGVWDLPVLYERILVDSGDGTLTGQ